MTEEVYVEKDRQNWRYKEESLGDKEVHTL